MQTLHDYLRKSFTSEMSIDCQETGERFGNANRSCSCGPWWPPVVPSLCSGHSPAFSLSLSGLEPTLSTSVPSNGSSRRISSTCCAFDVTEWAHGTENCPCLGFTWIQLECFWKEFFPGDVLYFSFYQNMRHEVLVIFPEKLLGSRVDSLIHP